MRLSRFALLGLVLFSVPAVAQAGKPIFGSHTCSQPVPCEDRGDISSAQWAEAGTSCLTSGLGYGGPAGVIDDVAGLDSSYCLTTNKSVIASNGAGPRLLPRCCVVKSPANTCVIHCELEQE